MRKVTFSIFLILTSTVVFHCSENSASPGGAIWSGYSMLSPTDCTFLRNAAAEGGGLFCWVRGEAKITNCAFSEDSAQAGPGIYWEGYGHLFLTITHTITAFGREGGAAQSWRRHGDVALTCCDLYGNEGGDWIDWIRDQVNVNGNFSLDPLFCDAAADDYTLMHCSPCAPGNHPDGWDCGLIGALPVGCAGTAIDRTTWGRIKTMFR